jgi:hypothetical protein
MAVRTATHVEGRAPLSPVVRPLLPVQSLAVALDALDFVSTVREGDFVAATPERLCGLYVIVDKPRLVSDLQEFLRELGFVAAHPRGEGLDVSIPGSPDTAQARRVVNVYLAIWEAIHPGVHASIAERNPRVSSAA